MRLGSLATLLALTLLAASPAAAFAGTSDSGPSDGCLLAPKARIAAFLETTPEMVTSASTHPDPGHLRCEFKTLRHVVGGSDAVSGEIILDYYHLANAERAKQQLATLGAPDLVVKTGGAAGTDAVVKLAEQIGAADVNREPGFAARHNENIAVLQMNGSFMADRPADWAYGMQSAALTAAGAAVEGSLFTEVCRAVPANDIQTLLTLQPAVLTTNNEDKGSLARCRFEAEVDGRSAGRATLEVKHNQTKEQIQSAQSDGDRSMLAQTNDNSDAVIVPPGTRGKAMAIHGSTVATIELDDPDVYAIVSPSFAYRVQRAALQAAGATVIPTAKYGADPVPQRVKPAPPPTLWDKFTDALGSFNLGMLGILIPVLVFGGLAVSFIRRGRLRKRLMTEGLPGIARIDAVSDTGTTVNNRPMVRFDVTIKTEAGTEYPASTRGLVSRLMAPASLVGSSQPVRIDRNDPQKFIFLSQL